MAVGEQTISALVLHKVNLSEADVFLDLLTNLEGRITVTSRGVQFLKSRLRYALEPYSVISATIIPTRNSGWRLINASFKQNLFYDLSGQDQKVLIRLVELIRRVVPPEEPELLYQELVIWLSEKPSFVINNYLLIAIYLLSSVGYLNFDLINDLRVTSKNEAEREISINLELSGSLIEFVDSNKTKISKATPQLLLEIKKVVALTLRNSQL